MALQQPSPRATGWGATDSRCRTNRRWRSPCADFRQAKQVSSSIFRYSYVADVFNTFIQISRYIDAGRERIVIDTDGTGNLLADDSYIPTISSSESL